MWPNSNRVGVFESNQKLEKTVSSRYKSPTPRRSPSPNTPRIITKTPSPISTRAVSTERWRPGTPQSPSRPSTPVHDTSVNMDLAARKVATAGKLPESLWPSRMRSLSVSLSTSKKEKPPPQALSDLTLKSSSNNVPQKRSVTLPVSRKSTPERKRSPLKGKNVIDQSENSKPLVDQHLWPSKTVAKVLTKTVDFPDKHMKTFIAPNRNFGASSFRRTQLEKSASDPVSVRLEYDNLQRVSNLVSSSLSVRSQSLPATGARPPSPKKPCGWGSKRPVSPAPSRGVGPLRQPCNSNKVSVLTFVADIKKGKKVANQIEDAHYLRLLHNRQIQWRFVNARAQAVLKSQKVTAEKFLFNVWRNTSELRDSVAAKRIDLHQLRLKLTLYSVLNQQMTYLNEWASIEREHNLSLAGAIEDLESSTLRLPVTEGAVVDIDTVKSSLCSAIQVIQTLGSSIQSTLSRLEERNTLVSELATVAAEERALFDEYEVLLVSVASLQVKEYSLRTQLVQLKQKLTPPS